MKYWIDEKDIPAEKKLPKISAGDFLAMPEIRCTKIGFNSCLSLIKSKLKPVKDIVEIKTKDYKMPKPVGAKWIPKPIEWSEEEINEIIVIAVSALENNMIRDLHGKPIDFVDRNLYRVIKNAIKHTKFSPKE